MKFSLVILFTICFGFMKSQTQIAYDTLDCKIKTLYSSDSEPIGEKIENKLEAWRTLIEKCPDKSQNVYKFGIKLFKYLVEMEKDSGNRELYIDTLFFNYEQQLKYFSDSANVLGLFAIDLLKYKPNEFYTAYSMLQESIGLEPHKQHFKYLYFVQVSEISYKKGLINTNRNEENKALAFKNLEYVLELETMDYIKENIRKTKLRIETGEW